MTEDQRPETNDQPLREAQQYQSLGQPSPELQHATDRALGWAGATPEPIADMQVDHDSSFWNRRANRQAQATGDDTNYAADFFGATDNSPSINNWAGAPNDTTVGYGPVPTGPFKGYAEDGIIDGATASTETPASPPYP